MSLSTIRRISVIALFLPFTSKEHLVVIDYKLRQRPQQYRAPAVHPSEEKGSENDDKSRLNDNLNLRHTLSYCRYIAKQYHPIF